MLSQYLPEHWIPSTTVWSVPLGWGRQSAKPYGYGGLSENHGDHCPFKTDPDTVSVGSPVFPHPFAERTSTATASNPLTFAFIISTPFVPEMTELCHA